MVSGICFKIVWEGQVRVGIKMKRGWPWIFVETRGWIRQWHPTPVLLPGKFHGWRSLHGRLQSMGSLRVGHDWATSLSLFTFMHWRRKWQPTPVFLPGESQERGGWWAAVSGVAQSWTRLKWLSSSSSRGWINYILYVYMFGIFYNKEVGCCERDCLGL